MVRRHAECVAGEGADAEGQHCTGYDENGQALRQTHYYRACEAEYRTCENDGASADHITYTTADDAHNRHAKG